ncbi:MIP/aquaporin family protein [Nonomuraea sp. NPDC005983]|uniref:MIP/aquaporin family protein n=1 Tax=Nonomuraea sp. NPDC005983 TaxID=3155595 RepID=UPI0033AFAC2A
MGLLLGAAGRAESPLIPAPSSRSDPSPRVNGSVHRLGRRLAAEAVGTGALVSVVIGSGIQAAELSQDGAVVLLANSLATVFGLGVLIAVLGPVSGAHFNPLVSLAAWWSGRGDGQGLLLRDVAAYAVAQIGGAVGGAVLANAVFARPLVSWSTRERQAGHLWLAEVAATAGLIVVIFGLTRTGRSHLAPVSVAAYIGAAYWFTSSTSFANPAVTIGRAFTDTYAGITPTSVGPFILAQVLGTAVGLGLVAVIFGPHFPTSAPRDIRDSSQVASRDAASAASAEQGSSRS